MPDLKKNPVNKAALETTRTGGEILTLQEPFVISFGDDVDSDDSIGVLTIDEGLLSDYVTSTNYIHNGDNQELQCRRDQNNKSSSSETKKSSSTMSGTTRESVIQPAVLSESSNVVERRVSEINRVVEDRESESEGNKLSTYKQSWHKGSAKTKKAKTKNQNKSQSSKLHRSRSKNNQVNSSVDITKIKRVTKSKTKTSPPQRKKPVDVALDIFSSEQLSNQRILDRYRRAEKRSLAISEANSDNLTPKTNKASKENEKKSPVKIVKKPSIEDEVEGPSAKKQAKLD